MASVRRIIDAHGGRIAVENQPPGGIRLTVIFPVAR
jgi:signal transduction histidine kinase